MTDYLEFTGPAALTTRGTVIVVPGRGETADAYRRFGVRVATESYQVRVLAEQPTLDSADGSVERLTTALADIVADLGPELVRPLVLVGSDTGAAGIAALVARRTSDTAWWPDALVLAALPAHGAHDVGGDWQDELDARTHCPVHRGVLTGDGQLHRGTLAAAVDADLLDEAYGNTTDVATLLLIGDADPLVDLQALRSVVKCLPTARLCVVHAAHHDVLNDLQHRSVAAEIITFLETVRNGRPLTPIVSALANSW